MSAQRSSTLKAGTPPGSKSRAALSDTTLTRGDERSLARCLRAAQVSGHTLHAKKQDGVLHLRFDPPPWRRDWKHGQRQKPPDPQQRHGKSDAAAQKAAGKRNAGGSTGSGSKPAAAATRGEQMEVDGVVPPVASARAAEPQNIVDPDIRKEVERQQAEARKKVSRRFLAILRDRVKSMHKLQARSSNQKLPTRTCRVILPGLAAQDVSLIDGSKAARISDEAAWAEAISHYEKANADTQWEACLDAFFADLLQLPAR